jgi:molybdopterin molybdotransferase
MLVPFESAVQLVQQQVLKTSTESVLTLDALGRVLASDVFAQKTIPFADTSAMDGFAFAFIPGINRFDVVGTTWAGAQRQERLMTGQAVKIMTGGRLPVGADTVAKKEDVKELGSGIEIHGVIHRGDFVRPKGEDTVLGNALLRAGQKMGVSHLAALVSHNIAKIEVSARPTVGLICTGDELVPFGATSNPDSIIDVNGPMLELLTSKLAQVTRVPLVKDSPIELLKAVDAVAHQNVIIVTGGASVGDKDFTKQTLSQWGVTWHFSGVAMKPGKPVAFGTKNNTLVFALQGNLVSALVTFELFVRPALQRMQSIPIGVRVPAMITHELDSLPTLQHFVRAHCVQNGDILQATALESQSSAAVKSALYATHLISVPAGAERLHCNDTVELIEIPWN